MFFVKSNIRYKHIYLLLFFFFIKSLIILCNKNTLKNKNIFNCKGKKYYELYINRKKKSKYTSFIYFNNIYKKIDVNEKEHKLNEDLKNIILLFGRIAEHYYPNTVEQFNFYKEPYSKYIYTNDSKNSKKWKYVFNNEKINKNVFYERICELKFKWPINQNENITEYNFYNVVIEKCLNNINIIRHNIHNLKLFLTKMIENNKNKENVFLHNLYNELENELTSDNKISLNGELVNDKKKKFLERLQNLDLNDIFKQHNRSYSRFLVNEVFNREYPSKKTIDIFLYLIFQKNVDEFTFDYFSKHLNKLGKKIEIYNCNYNSNIYFDHFFFLMKNELKKNSFSVKRKKGNGTSKVIKGKKENILKSSSASKNKVNLIENQQNTESNKKTKKQNFTIIGQNIVKFNKIKEKEVEKEKDEKGKKDKELENLYKQSNIIKQENSDNEKNTKKNTRLETNILTNSETKDNLKKKIISFFRYLVNQIKSGF
ncbi:conserved Plasmodium protein, unknown function [Plasmodium relictum]|uniref:Uncharacterized protein n=1 Tax=Plasmodium relictum TaxID=85471 RepID=A0A1J1H4A9_PLARL|nr:conserved Plasmodium protein, unknown function [Plasmodium relictum]CRG99578.1 conserved Plasmodium protein, unknown function [Plasmodium relictum]